MKYTKRPNDICLEILYTIAKNGCYMPEILDFQRNMPIFGCQFFSSDFIFT